MKKTVTVYRMNLNVSTMTTGLLQTTDDIVFNINERDSRYLASNDPEYRTDRLMQQLGVAALFLGVCT